MKAAQARWIRFRLLVVLGVFVLAWAGILWRAFQLQVLQHDRLVKIAAAECRKVIELKPVRGELYDRNGEKLAVSLAVDSIFARPMRIKKPATAAAELAEILGLERRSLTRELRSEKPFVWVKRQASPEETGQVRALGLEGVGFIKESKRFYPNRQLAAHVLGFVGVDARGLEGLELAQDKYLRGDVNYWPVMRDALGRTFLDQIGPGRVPAQGHSLILTLDRRIQYVTEKALQRAVEEHNARSGVAIVVRPRTGEVLALAVAPGYNPNAFAQSSAARRRNLAVTDTFDPGSTFKVFLVAAALEEGVVRPLDLIYCENGQFRVGHHVIHDSGPGHGWLTINKVVKFSSNIGAVKIGQKLGPEDFHRYLLRFGFGQRTGIDLPGEASGRVRPPEGWRKIDAANIAFGQGVTVTALQMVMAMSALANDGLLMRPFLVSAIIDSSGRPIKRVRPQVVRRVVSSQTSRELRRMLRLVVEEGGTGTRAEPHGYPAAGKTGTAQKLDRRSRTYSDHKFVSSFVGFAPADDPELSIFIALDEPWPEFYGGKVAAPVFREIAEQVLPLLNVPPEPEPGVRSVRARDEGGRPGSGRVLRVRFEPKG